MPHTHEWYVTVNLMLTLPDLVETTHDRLICWACRGCPEELVTTANYALASPLLWPDAVTTLLQAERRQGTPLARLAAKQEPFHRLKRRRQ